MTSLINFIIVASLYLGIISCSSEYNWTDQELNILSSFKLTNLDNLTTNPSNKYANNNHAANFGKSVFFDKQFSLDKSISCESCHQSEQAFTDGLSKAKGIRETKRNTPTLYGAAYLNWFYWDGRKDSLWSQALEPFESTDEMASSRIKVLRIIGLDPVYRQQYEFIFGEFPDIVYEPLINENANPIGNPQAKDYWANIAINDQAIINKAYSNIGKAIEAYQRTIKIPSTKLDKYIDAVSKNTNSKNTLSLNKEEYSGLKLFLDQSKTHCLRCHNGPMFTDSEFHNIGTKSLNINQIDSGRMLGIKKVLHDEFNCLSDYSDAHPDDCDALRFLPKHTHSNLHGAFKTPTLRYLKKTAPYFHDGRFATLEEVLDHYLNADETITELPKLNLSDKEKHQLIAFLNLLN